MKHIEPFAIALIGFLGIETINLTELEIIVKICAEISVSAFTCYYIYRKTKYFKK